MLILMVQIEKVVVFCLLAAAFASAQQRRRVVVLPSIREQNHFFVF